MGLALWATHHFLVTGRQAVKYGGRSSGLGFWTPVSQSQLCHSAAVGKSFELSGSEILSCRIRRLFLMFFKVSSS